MMKKLFLFTAGLMLMSNVCFAGVNLWNLNQVDAYFNEEMLLKVEQEFRFSDGINDFAYESSDVGIVWLPTDYMTLGVNFRQVFADTGAGFVPESRPHVNIGFNTDLFDEVLEVSDRIRTELRFVDDEDMALRFRNLLTLGVDVLSNVKLVVSDELFVTTDGLDENRAAAGLRLDVNSKLDVALAYQLQTTGLGEDESTNGHGILANIYMSF